VLPGGRIVCSLACPARLRVCMAGRLPGVLPHVCMPVRLSGRLADSAPHAQLPACLVDWLIEGLRLQGC
jgi:hypothetical protein